MRCAKSSYPTGFNSVSRFYRDPENRTVLGIRRKTGLRIHEIEIIERGLLRKVQPYVRAIKIRETAVSTEMTNGRGRKK